MLLSSSRHWSMRTRASSTKWPTRTARREPGDARELCQRSA
jgi:hypothetical protein